MRRINKEGMIFSTISKEVARELIENSYGGNNTANDWNFNKYEKGALYRFNDRKGNDVLVKGIVGELEELSCSYSLFLGFDSEELMFEYLKKEEEDGKLPIPNYDYENNLHVLEYNSINEFLFEEIADGTHLQLIKTSSKSNGEPFNLKDAIIGFDNFEQAKEIALKYNLNITVLRKQNGWQYWCRTGKKAVAPFEKANKTFVENHSQYVGDGKCERDFVREEVLSLFTVLSLTPNYCTFDSLEKIVSNMKRIYEKIDSSTEDEIIIVNKGVYEETVKNTPMYFYQNTKHLIIGLINN